MMIRSVCVVLATLAAAGTERVQAQTDSVDVTFRYQIPGETLVSVPGEFNGWSPPTARMDNQGGGLWTKTVRLHVGGNPAPSGVPGAWQYKFWYNGVTDWPNDPLNHHVNASEYNNSFVYVRHPTIYHLLPNQRSAPLETNLPVISAYIFPKVGSTVDTGMLELVLDGVTHSGLGSLYDPVTRKLTFVPPAPVSAGSHTAILHAGASSDTVSFVTTTGGPVFMTMPGYAAHGVTLPSAASADSTTFRLRLGGASYVLLRIAPAGQPVASATPYYLRKNPGTDDWWINLPISAGTYEYLYQTSGGAVLYDPWGRHNGTYGSRFTIGPEGVTADDYVWGSTDYRRPPMNRLVVYELHVGEFAGGYYGLPAGQAGFSHLTTLMGYLDSLGVNAIELMPVNDFGSVGRSTEHSWGYNNSHFFALEPAYGTPRDFKRLVDSAHAHGIAVILDAVFNHQYESGPLWQMQPDEAANPYFKACNDLRYNEDQLCFFKDMDHWTPETQEIVYEAIRMWLDVYRVDGFRYDFTQGIGWNTAEPDRGIPGWANRIALEYGDSVYQLAEHLPESPALVYHTGLTGGWHDSFRSRMFDEARTAAVSLTDMENLVLDLGAFPGNDVPALPNRYADRTEPVNANVNHDTQSLIYEMVTFQGVPLATALQRDKLYALFMFASLGTPMLWQGMELSAPRGWLNDSQKLVYRPVEWDLLPTARGQEHLQYYRALIRQRTHNPALFNGRLRTLWRFEAQRVLVWGMEDSTSGARFMAVANLSASQQTVTNIPWLSAGIWYDIWDQSVFVVNSRPVPSLTVSAYTALCYSNLPDQVLFGTTVTRPVAAGWNLISVPVVPASFAAQSLFPAAVSSAFRYDGGYHAADTLDTGIGYWVKFGAGGEVQLAGEPVARETVAVNAGWNLIGTVSEALHAGEVVAFPPVSVLSPLYGFHPSGGYAPSDTLHPGGAYWVKVDSAGSLILGGGPP